MGHQHRPLLWLWGLAPMLLNRSHRSAAQGNTLGGSSSSTAAVEDATAAVEFVGSPCEEIHVKIRNISANIYYMDMKSLFREDTIFDLLFGMTCCSKQYDT